MGKKDIALYSVIFVLAIIVMWQWVSSSSVISKMNSQITEMNKDIVDFRLMSGIGALRSTHEHADIKVYINGQAIDFSQPEYQLAARYVHFEEGVGDVIHIHATGITLGQLFNSLGMDFNQNCFVYESVSYCTGKDKTLKFYVNGKPSAEFNNKLIKDFDKYLISYGNENDAEIQKQLASITNLAPELSAKG
ncbi:MAG: hypothetical protein AABX00_05635 [Nanoarchaeota archaeon]